jgi:hypothetical protein
MKFTVAAILSAVASAVYAQTAPATAGVSVNLPSLGVSSKPAQLVSSTNYFFYLIF